MKSPKPRNKAQRKVDYKNYDAMSKNYEEKLLQEIINDAENVRIIGILAYQKREEGREREIKKNLFL